MSARPQDCTFAECSAAIGGAVFVDHGSTVDVRGCAFRENYANLDGGAVAVRDHSALAAAGCLFWRNAAGRDGGALHVSNRSTLELVGPVDDGGGGGGGGGESAFVQNSASAGSAVYIIDESVMRADGGDGMALRFLSNAAR